MASPQLENGFLQIASGEEDNDIIRALVKASLSGTEYQIILWVIRKTYGYKKTEDWISLTQFCEITSKNRTNICRSIKQLVAKKALVVKSTPGKTAYYSLNKDFDKWKTLVAKKPLVAKKAQTSGENDNQLVAKKTPTKDNIQKITQKRGNFVPPSLSEVSEYIKEQHYNVDAEQWMNFYESKGWMIGKTKMVKWKNAVATWAKRNGDKPKMNALEQDAKELVQKYGQDVAHSKFLAKHTCDELLSVKHIINL